MVKPAVPAPTAEQKIMEISETKIRHKSELN